MASNPIKPVRYRHVGTRKRENEDRLQPPGQCLLLRNPNRDNGTVAADASTWTDRLVEVVGVSHEDYTAKFTGKGLPRDADPLDVVRHVTEPLRVALNAAAQTHPDGVYRPYALGLPPAPTATEKSEQSINCKAGRCTALVLRSSRTGYGVRDAPLPITEVSDAQNDKPLAATLLGEALSGAQSRISESNEGTSAAADDEGPHEVAAMRDGDDKHPDRKLVHVMSIDHGAPGMSERLSRVALHLTYVDVPVESESESAQEEQEGGAVQGVKRTVYLKSRAEYKPKERAASEIEHKPGTSVDQQVKEALPAVMENPNQGGKVILRGMGESAFPVGADKYGKFPAREVPADAPPPFLEVQRVGKDGVPHLCLFLTSPTEYDLRPPSEKGGAAATTPTGTHPYLLAFRWSEEAKKPEDGAEPQPLFARLEYTSTGTMAARREHKYDGATTNTTTTTVVRDVLHAPGGGVAVRVATAVNIHALDFVYKKDKDEYRYGGTDPDSRDPDNPRGTNTTCTGKVYDPKCVTKATQPPAGMVVMSDDFFACVGHEDPDDGAPEHSTFLLSMPRKGKLAPGEIMPQASRAVSVLPKDHPDAKEQAHTAVNLGGSAGGWATAGTAKPPTDLGFSGSSSGGGGPEAAKATAMNDKDQLDQNYAMLRRFIHKLPYPGSSNGKDTCELAYESKDDGYPSITFKACQKDQQGMCQEYFVTKVTSVAAKAGTTTPDGKDVCVDFAPLSQYVRLCEAGSAGPAESKDDVDGRFGLKSLLWYHHHQNGYWGQYDPASWKFHEDAAAAAKKNDGDEDESGEAPTLKQVTSTDVELVYDTGAKAHELVRSTNKIERDGTPSSTVLVCASVPSFKPTKDAAATIVLGGDGKSTALDFHGHIHYENGQTRCQIIDATGQETTDADDAIEKEDEEDEEDGDDGADTDTEGKKEDDEEEGFLDRLFRLLFGSGADAKNNEGQAATPSASASAKEEKGGGGGLLSYPNNVYAVWAVVGLAHAFLFFKTKTTEPQQQQGAVVQAQAPTHNPVVVQQPQQPQQASI